MQEVWSRFRTEFLWKKLHTRSPDWLSLFSLLDKDQDGLISKIELREAIKTAGMAEIAEAEAEFAFGIISQFGKSINQNLFQEWA